MTIEDAVKLLTDKLQSPAWLVAIGIGKHEGREAIYVYYKSRPPKNFFVGICASDYWHGFKVLLKKMGAPRAALGLEIRVKE